MAKAKTRTKYHFTMLRIDKLSAVDKPAQEGALAILRKRDDGKPSSGDATTQTFKIDDIAKRLRLLTDVDGHTHLIDDSEQGGTTSYAKSETGDEYGHSHAWVKNDDGTITVGSANGHSHDVIQKRFSDNATTGRAKPDPSGGDDVEKDDELKAKIAELQKRLDRAEACGRLNDAEKAHLAKLDDTRADVFLKSAPSDRKAAIETAKAEDAVIYKADDGSEYRKSDDPRLIEMAKRADSNSKALAASEAARRREEFAKRAATELRYLPGKEDAKIEVLKAIESMPEAIRDEARAMIKAANAALNQDSMLGVSGDPNPLDGVNPEAALDQLATRHLEEARKRGDAGVTFEKAYVEVLHTDEGRKLHGQVRKLQEARS